MEDYFDNDEFKEILQQYEQSRKTGKPAYLDALDYVDLSDYYLNQDQPREAIQAINQGLKSFPGDPDLLAAEAGAYVDEGHFDKARKSLAKIPANADCPERRYVQARIALNDELDVEKAERLFHKWIAEVDDKYADRIDEEDIIDYRRHCHSQVIVSYYEQTEYDDYDDQIQNLLGDWIQLYLDKWKTMGEYEADFIVAETCRSMMHIEAIEEIYKRLLDHDPYLQKGWDTLAMAQHMNQHHEEALESAAYALAINPDNSRMMHVQADCHFALEHYDQALPLYLQYLESDDAKNLSDQDLCSIEVNTANCLLAQGDKDTALKHLDTANAHLRKVHLGVTVPDARTLAWVAYQLAMAYTIAGQHRKALAAVHKSMKCAPHNVDDRALESVLQLFVGNSKGPQRFMDYGESHPTEGVYCFLALGQLMMTLGSVQLAEQVFLEYVKLLDQGAFDDIHLLESKAIDTFSGSDVQMEDGYAHLCLAAYLSGDYKTMREWLPKAQEQAPQVFKRLFKGTLPSTLSPEDYFSYLSNL